MGGGGGNVGALLPPGADAGTPGGQVALPAQQVPLPTHNPIQATAEGTVLIPTAEGGTVAVPEQPKKTVRIGGEEREVETMTQEEKDRRRLQRTFIMAAIGVAILGILAYVLVHMSS